MAETAHPAAMMCLGRRATSSKTRSMPALCRPRSAWPILLLAGRLWTSVLADVAVDGLPPPEARAKALAEANQADLSWQGTTLAVTAAPPLAPPAGGGRVLPQEIYGFKLVGNSAASLRDVNGGGNCVGPRGYDPPGYTLTGDISLSACAQIAQLQNPTTIIGFRWGREGFDAQAYQKYAKPVGLDGAAQADAQVILDELFPRDSSKFTCSIYLINKDLDRAKFTDTPHDDNFQREEIAVPGAGEGRRLLEDASLNERTLQGRRRRKKRQIETSVCNQRYSLTQFFSTEVTDLWFCYTLKADEQLCQDGKNQNMREELVFFGCLLTFLAVGSYILRKQDHLMWALYWLTNFLVNLELAIIAVYFLVSKGYTFVFLWSLLIVVVGGNLLLSPCWCVYQGGHLPAPLMFYFLVLTTSPVVLLDMITYLPGVPLTLQYKPVLIGLIGFVIEVIKDNVLRLRPTLNSLPHNKYQPVPTKGDTMMSSFC